MANDASVRETARLLGDEKITFMGHEMVNDAEGWHWVMVFPLRTDANKDSWSKKQCSWPNTSTKLAEKIFKPKAWDGLGYKSSFTDNMTKEEFHKMVREKLLTLFSSSKCGFKLETMESVDGDEIFLKIALEDKAAQKSIAAKQEIRMPVKHDAYDKKALQCPTTEYYGGKFSGEDKVPLHVSYSMSGADQIQDFRDLDLCRMIFKRISHFIRVHALESSGVVINMFPVHRWSQLSDLDKEGWSRIQKCCQMPTGRHSDVVRNYFGEEVGFFFHWFNYYSYSLSLPAILGFVLFFRRFVFDLITQRMVQVSFAFIMCIWSAYFTSAYKQSSNLKIVKWGMKNYAAVATVRKEYKEEKRGTCSESMQKGFHWFLVLVFMGETIGAVFWISAFRKQALDNPDGMVYGMPGKTASQVAKLLVTANIKIVDQLWKRLSPCLSECENWKTQQECKSAMVNKLFIVKFVIYYYPFFYIAFMKEHIEGCPDPITGCTDELKQNLAIFFFTHVATVIALIVLPMVMTKWSISSEIKAAEKKGSSKPYTYLQAQAKCPVYAGDTDDFMELVLSLGFVMMFAVELPVMAFLALISNMFELRLLAFKMAYVMQRSDPRGQEGIGAWQHIIQTVSVVAVIVNVGIAIFCMHPLRDLSLKAKLAIFICAENGMLLVQRLVEATVPDKSLSLVVIEEINADAIDDIMGDVDKPVNAPWTNKPAGGLPIELGNVA